MTPDALSPSPKVRSLLPAPSALAVFVVLGVLGVLVLPAVATVMPLYPAGEPRAVQSALTAAGLVLLTAGYIWAVAKTSGWEGRPAVLTLAFLGAIVIVKFILSPGSFHNTPEATLSTYLWLGLGVMPLYLAGIAALYWLALRHRGRTWTWVSKAATVLALLAIAGASRYLAALVLARDVSDYLAEAFRGGGLLLLALLGGSAIAAIEAFDRTGRELAFRVGATVIVIYHALWAVFMFRLFD